MDPNLDDLISQVRDAQASIRVYLDGPDGDWPNKISRIDLAKCLGRMRKIDEELTSGPLPAKTDRKSGMGRMIVDCWPMDFELGDRLLGIEQAYVKLDERSDA
jgi:hypothetical protein